MYVYDENSELGKAVNRTCTHVLTTPSPKTETAKAGAHPMRLSLVIRKLVLDPDREKRCTPITRADTCAHIYTRCSGVDCDDGEVGGREGVERECRMMLRAHQLGKKIRLGLSWMGEVGENGYLDGGCAFLAKRTSSSQESAHVCVSCVFLVLVCFDGDERREKLS